MKIKFPNISQSDIDYAISCLEKCKQDSAEDYGFLYPYFAPGGGYGKQWWQLDFSLALCGYKWVDRAFCERALENFINSQKEDGRICLWGADTLPETVAGGDKLSQTENISSLPKIFDAAYHILLGSRNKELKERTYEMLKRYLDWWFLHRQDKKTGLITAVFEETFIPYLGSAYEYAPVDTNVEVYVGLYYTQLIAKELCKNSDFEKFEERKNKLKDSINRYLYSEEKGAYFPYYIKEEKQGETLMASTFYPLRLEIAPKDRRERLIKLLKDNAHFNFNSIPITSVSMKDSAFRITEGEYIGNASWSGNVWTLINEMVIRSLCDIGENALAAELALKTLDAFKSNCAEFINPFDKKGHGVKEYAWSASQFLEILVDVLFGIEYNAVENTITISPKICDALKNERLQIKGLCLMDTVKLDVGVYKGKVNCSVSDSSVRIKVQI